jgi:hypothetical protein
VENVILALPEIPEVINERFFWRKKVIPTTPQLYIFWGMGKLNPKKKPPIYGWLFGSEDMEQDCFSATGIRKFCDQFYSKLNR